MANCIVRGNTASYGGGIYIYFVGEAILHGCRFLGNSVTETNGGEDIGRDGIGDTEVLDCSPGYFGGTRGAALDTSGDIQGSPYSYSGCRPCAR